MTIQGVVMAFQIGAYRVGQPESTLIVNGFLNVFNVVVSGHVYVYVYVCVTAVRLCRSNH